MVQASASKYEQVSELLTKTKQICKLGVHARINGPGIIEIENCEKEGSTSTEITKEDVLDIPDCINIRRHFDTKSYESIRKQIYSTYPSFRK